MSFSQITIDVDVSGVHVCASWKHLSYMHLCYKLQISYLSK